jgi:2-polyprenyl-6-methoxyphenol hydroxylase-like FAD-dependent oxidoreductase
MAIEDAVVLAECLNRLVPLEVALRDFAERRMPRARFVHERSRASLVNEMVHDKAAADDSYAQVMPRRMAEIDRFLSQPA